MKKIYFFLIAITWHFSCFSQHITAQLIDKNNGRSIPYASIKTGVYKGVISNEEGYFTIYSENNNIKSVTISCLGYLNKTISIDDIIAFNYIIKLEEAVHKLNAVYLSNKPPNADSIIAKVKAHTPINYKSELNHYAIFRRTTDYIDFKSLEFEIEKASHIKKHQLEAANKSLNALSNKIKNSDIKEFADLKGELYVLDKDSSKLEVEKATKLLDHKNDFSMEEVQDKAQNLVLEYLDTTKTYKLKTGLFKIEDSLALNKGDFKDEHNKNEYKTASLNKKLRSFLKRAQYYDNSFLFKLLDFEYYNFKYQNMTYDNNELTYIIHFTPKKSKAKYTGKIYVNQNTYAITRLDYAFYKNRHGDKLNLKFLLGIKFNENMSEGTLLFKKDSNNMYHPKYLKRTNGSYFYVNRDVKFIENTHAKKKVNFSFKLEGDARNKEELLFISSNELTLDDFNSIKQDSIVTFSVLSTFDKTLWEKEETLEPSTEMKTFSTTD
ncbi:hypothetical protein KFZ70_00800 [Tamlana fucoidanivorans]|uniref:Carboxypeptidase-like regulatory domain-containing protein n=1 Tax=Allotamlana fucoidanivorans TaxID=2583814 RepID=A0A5C4SMF2_9FLAO|nr:carboxypeptidase-like regulatory domain-containing protein [Tamlana fucoidanivorans]TNJ44553.1 carboxypeptidase-like regulatory domain-containing protein [Tamlana fucoidanivorans]